MNLTLIVISILGGIQGLFFAFLLFHFGKSENNGKANRYLAFLTLILSVTLIIAFLHFTRLILHTPHLLGISPFFTMLYGPLLLFYISAFLQTGDKFSQKKWLHFLPFLILLVLSYPFLAMPASVKLSYLNNIFEDRYQPALNVFSIVRIIHLTLYLLIGYYLLQKVPREKSATPVIPQIKRNWIRNLIFASVLIWGVYLTTYVIDFNLMNLLLPLCITIAIYAMGYMGFKYPEIVQENIARKPSKKYESSRLTPAEKENYSEKLLALMAEKKSYHDSEITLNQLANEMGISSQHLSQVINEKFQQNFSDFINRFRIEEAKRKLLDPRNRQLTILAIAYDVGFNSKSAFYTAFKKATGQTPSDFIREKQLQN